MARGGGMAKDTADSEQIPHYNTMPIYRHKLQACEHQGCLILLASLHWSCHNCRCMGISPFLLEDKEGEEVIIINVLLRINLAWIDKFLQQHLCQRCLWE